MAQILDFEETFGVRRPASERQPASAREVRVARIAQAESDSYWPEVACGLWVQQPVDAANSPRRVLGEIALILGGCGLLIALIAILLPAPARADPLPAPAMSASLSANADPYGVDLDWAGKWSVGGAVSGLAYYQDNPNNGVHSQLDLDNGQIWIEKTDGWWQAFVQAGVYTQPSLGFGYIRASQATTLLYGDVPFAYLKIVPADGFSISAGKLPTLIGAENAFTYQNLNIQRGLLWNQTPSVTQGVQANYASGPLSFSVSVNDGYYSQALSSISALASYAFDGGADTITAIAGTDLGHNPATLPFATPLLNDSTIADLIFTHASGPWTISPSLQYVSAPRDPLHGALQGASSLGAMLAVNYAFDDRWRLAGRAEYISSTGSAAQGSMNLLIAGPGSKAWSITLTPTYQYKVFFARLEGSYVGASDTTPGFAYGPAFDRDSQASVFFETGVLF